MKKFFLYIVLLLLNFQIFSSSTSTEMTHKILTIGFHGSVDEVEFGISKNQINLISDVPNFFVDDEIRFSQNEENSGSRLTEVFYIYWKIYTNRNFTLTVEGRKLENTLTFDVTSASDLSGFFDADGNSSELNIDLGYELPLSTPHAGSVPVQLKLDADQLSQTSIGNNTTFEGMLTLTLSTT